MTPRTPCAAYFCMEFGLDESFPIYSGGLGVLAGDLIKSAHDLELPLVAVGLLWERGYAIQRIGDDGQPHDSSQEYDHAFLEDTGVSVRVRVRGREIACTVWHTQRFGNAPLYLLQPTKVENRWITQRLYDSGSDVRVAQEMVLGIGGLRALNWLGIPVAAYHFNEGHAVFAGIEMIAERMAAGMTFPDAWTDTRRQIVFTTHTPVRAGNEEHAIADLRRIGACLELSGAEMRALGGDPFNMTVAGLRLARLANAVSQLHGETARAMWAYVTDAAPILAITNGVHAPTWQAHAIRQGHEDPETLWQAHTQLKLELVNAIREREGTTVDPESLFIGFARRAATYKRSDLILRDEARLSALLAEHRVTLLFSGKAHPDDTAGKAIVSRLVAAGREHPGRIVFLENYDMALGRLLTRGCDVWLNNPVRPMEASGTSGMKAALNGVLNLSILDGWWPEGCEHGVTGWAIPSDTPGDDARDLAGLYTTLLGEVLPAWADRSRWLQMMHASIEMAETKFTSDRMVREYFARLYPAELTAHV